MFQIFYLFGFQQKKPKKLKLVIKDSHILRLKTGLIGEIYPEGMSCVHLRSHLYLIQSW